jgi:hypothetical protein
MEIEVLGTPAVLAASSAFVQAADEQAVLLGRPELHRVHVGHPILNRTDDETRALARATVDELLAAVSS